MKNVISVEVNNSKKNKICMKGRKKKKQQHSLDIVSAMALDQAKLVCVKKSLSFLRRDEF